MAMQEYDFDIEHRSGARKQHVDAPSRNTVKITAITSSVRVYSVQNHNYEIQLIKQQLTSFLLMTKCV